MVLKLKPHHFKSKLQFRKSKFVNDVELSFGFKIKKSQLYDYYLVFFKHAPSRTMLILNSNNSIYMLWNKTSTFELGLKRFEL